MSRKNEARDYRICPKHLNERPGNISIDWPILQVKNRKTLHLEDLFSDFKEYLVEANEEGLGKKISMLFVSQFTDHWFYAHDTVPPSGIIIESHGHDASDLLGAYTELVRLFRFKEQDVVWTSDYVLEAKKGFSKEVPRFSRAH